MGPGPRQAGFTLIELLVAATVGMLLIVAMFHAVGHSVLTTNALISQVTLNREARAMFDIMGEGGVKDVSDDGLDYTNPVDRVPGYYGRFSNPMTVDLKRTPTRPYRLTLKSPDSTGEVYSTAVTQFNVACETDGDPIPDCLVSDPVKNVDGYVGDDPETVQDTVTLQPLRSVSSITPEVRWTLMDPHRLPVNGMERQYALSDYVQVYWTAYSLLVDYY